MSGGIGSTFGNSLLQLIFQGTAIANIAQNGVSPLTQLYLSLHTADPGAGGAQNTSEAAYPGYARQAVNRTSGGFTVTGLNVTLTAAVSFPISTGTPSETETFFAVGTASSGAGSILGRGSLSPTIAVTAAGVTPQLTTGTTISIS
jgi:hypothetical protein